MVEDFRHLTWLGRAEMVWFALRRLVVSPAPYAERCISGYPIGEHVRCPRKATSDLWCHRHEPMTNASPGVVPSTPTPGGET